MITSGISERGAKTGSQEDFLLKYMGIARDNSYNETNNPMGIINMGTAVNRLMEEELRERLNAEDVWNFTPSDHQHYFPFEGTTGLREALSDFFSRHFSNGRKIPTEQLIVMNGVNSCLDAMAYVCCDPGDVMITPTPVYGRVLSNFEERCFVDVQPLHLRSGNCVQADEQFKLTAEALDDRILELQSEGKNVKAFVLINPQNPIGCVYDENLILDILTVCSKYKLHVIMDEIYALSVHSPDTPFKSVLAFQELPDPSRTHFLWGMSKDFGLAGLRVGVIQTSNADILRCLSVKCTFYGVPSIVQEAAATMLVDRKWCDEFFLPKSQDRLCDSFNRAVKRLTNGGVRVFESTAALFAWVDVSPFLAEQTMQDENALFEEFLRSGVYVLPGRALKCQQPGWFRIVVSLPEHEQQLGLSRFLSVLHARRNLSAVKG